MKRKSDAVGVQKEPQRVVETGFHRYHYHYQSVRTLQTMALLKCCGREALVHKWRTRKKEKAVCTTCQIVTLREKLKVITVLKDVLYVFISPGVVYLEFLDAVSRRYGRNTRWWTAIETHDFLQTGAYHENKTLTQKSEILRRRANYQARVFSWSICSCTLARWNVPKDFVVGRCSLD